MKTDKLFYRLFHTQPELVLELAGMQPPYPQGYRHRSLELKETSFRLDGVIHPPQGYPHVFWEAQFQGDKDFYARWLASIFICLHQERITAWRGLVLFPDRSLDVGDPTPYAPLLERGLIRRVYLDDLVQDVSERCGTVSWGLCLLRLIVAPEHQVPALTEDLLTMDDDAVPIAVRDQVLDLLETVLVYKFPELSREEIRTMLHLPDTDLTQTRFYREAFADGEARGEARGKHQGEVSLILRLLRKRLGAVSTEQEAAIRCLSLERLETLADELLDFRSEADLAEWLKQHRV